MAPYLKELEETFRAEENSTGKPFRKALGLGKLGGENFSLRPVV